MEAGLAGRAGRQRGTTSRRRGDGADGLRALRRENAFLRQENDILKKAAVIPGTRPQPAP